MYCCVRHKTHDVCVCAGGMARKIAAWWSLRLANSVVTCSTWRRCNVRTKTSNRCDALTSQREDCPFTLTGYSPFLRHLVFLGISDQAETLDHVYSSTQNRRASSAARLLSLRFRTFKRHLSSPSPTTHRVSTCVPCQ